VRNPSNPNRPGRRAWRLAAAIALLALAPVSPASAGVDDPKPVARANPQYPYGALHRGIEGWVLVEYTVNQRGQVVMPRVLEASPRGVFEREALRALSRWRYEPLSGEPKTMKVKLTFQK
jgi:protein TonB